MSLDSARRDFLTVSDQYIERQDWSGQRDLLRQAVAQFPDDPEFCYRYAVALSTDDPATAVEYVRQAAGHGDTDPLMLTRCAALMYELGAIAEAGRTAQRAIPLLGDDFLLIADLLHVIGKVCAWKGEYELAEESLTKAFEADPGAIGHARELAAFLVQRGRSDEALGIITRGLQHNSADRDLLEELRKSVDQPT